MASNLANKEKIQSLAEFLKKKLPAIRHVAAKHMNPDRVYRIALACVSRNPTLLQCSEESVFRSVLMACELGLEAGSALGEAYLVPFKQQCQLIPGYRGLIALAFRSGHVSSIYAQVVYQKDEFRFELGLDPQIKHIPSLDDDTKDPKTITHAYCVVRLISGGVLFDVMTKGEINRIRAKSPSGNTGAWVTDYAEMAKKTVTRRCLKYAPMSVEMSKALSVDAAVENGENVIDAEFDSLAVLADGEQAALSSGASTEIPSKGVAAVKDKVAAQNGGGGDALQGTLGQ